MNSLTSVQKIKEQLLGRFDDGAAQRRVVRRAYLKFAREYPHWAAALFDEHFLDHGAQPIIRALFEGSDSPSPAALAAAWAEQVWSSPRTRRDLIAELTPIAAEFLRRVSSKLRSQRALAGARLQPA